MKLKVEDVAAALGVSRWAIYLYIKAGLIKAKRYGRRWWIDKAELDRILREGLDTRGLTKKIKER